MLPLLWLFQGNMLWHGLQSLVFVSRFNIGVVIFSLDQTLCCSHCVPHRRTHIRRNCRHLVVNAELFWSQVGRVIEWVGEGVQLLEGGKILREGGRGRTVGTGVLKEQTRGTEEERNWWQGFVKAGGRQVQPLICARHIAERRTDSGPSGAGSWDRAFMWRPNLRTHNSTTMAVRHKTPSAISVY